MGDPVALSPGSGKTSTLVKAAIRAIWDDYVVLDAAHIWDHEQAWDYLKKNLIEFAQAKAMKARNRRRGRPGRGPGSGSNLGQHYPGYQYTPAQVLMRKAHELGGAVSQPRLARALGISVTTVWRILDDSGVGWPLPPWTGGSL